MVYRWKLRIKTKLTQKYTQILAESEFFLVYSFCYQKVWEIWSNVKAFFQKNWKKQLFIDFFTRLTNFKWLWKVNSQAFSNQTFFSILMGFQLIQINWKTHARCWHLVLEVPNVNFYFFNKLPFWRYSGNSFLRVPRNQKTNCKRQAKVI